MHRATRLRPALLVIGCLVTAIGFVQEDPCTTFSWNVSHERALFATPGTSLSAAQSGLTAPTLAPDQLYLLQLVPQAQVKFPVAPGKSGARDESYAGLLQLRVALAGDYRISLDQPAWIDVVRDGQAIASTEFQGRSGCHAPHKIVQFPLRADSKLLIQISAAPAAQLRMTITSAASPSIN